MKPRRVLLQEKRLEAVVEAEIEAAIDENTDAGDDETAIQPSDSVSFDRLDVDVDDPVELAIAARVLGVRRQPRPRVVDALDEAEREGAGASSAEDVLAESLPMRGVFRNFEHSLDLENKTNHHWHCIV